MKSFSLYFGSFALAVFTSLTASAAIISGDMILIDFGKDTQETSGNWNNISNNAERFTLSNNSVMPGASDLVRNSDGTGTGVSLHYMEDSDVDDTQTGIGIGGADNTDADSFSTFPESASRDILFLAGEETYVEFEIRGLDNALSYNLRFFGSVSSSNTRPDSIFNVDTDGNGTLDTEAFYNPAIASENGETGVKFASFSGVDSNSGVIKFRLQGDTTQGKHLGVMEIVAVPEPSSLLLLGAGMLVLTAACARRQSYRA